MRKSMDATELLSPKRVLVLGDMMLDRYTWGRAERVSPEAPVLVLKSENFEVRLGAPQPWRDCCEDWTPKCSWPESWATTRKAAPCGD